MAAKVNFTLIRGDTFRREITWKDSAGAVIDLSSAAAKMQLRSDPDATTILHALSVGNGITLAATAPNIILVISAATTSGFSFSRAVYDLEITHANGDVETIMAGIITLTVDVTR